MKTTEPNIVLEASVSPFSLFELRLSLRIAKNPLESETSLIPYKRFSPRHAVMNNKARVFSSQSFRFLNFYLMGGSMKSQPLFGHSFPEQSRNVETMGHH